MRQKLLGLGLKNLSAKEDYQYRQDLSQHTDQLSMELESLETENELLFLTGPITSSLDDALQSNGIYLQAYHERSLIGNHCHKYLKSSVFENISDKMLESTIKVTNNHLLQNKADDISAKFKALNSLYSDVHSLLSRASWAACHWTRQRSNSVSTTTCPSSDKTSLE